MSKNLLRLLFFLIGIGAFSQSGKVAVVHDEEGKKLTVDGKPFMVNGVNWDYVPIGNGILDKGIWNQGDELIKAALDAEMSLLKNMGGNAIRTYGIQPKWVRYIYEEYGIYTMINVCYQKRYNICCK